MPISIRDDPALSRYELVEGDDVIGELTYRLHDGRIALLHLGVDAERRGEGHAARLATFALDDARTRGLAVLPYCPYVHAFIQRHQAAYADLVAPMQRAAFGLPSADGASPASP